MPAYELFAATTTDLFIQNIKTKAEAYGWTIDFFGTYNSHNRLHLHNADGAHFEIWYASTTAVNIRGCTGYTDGAIPTAQPNVSGNCQLTASLQHFIVICPHSIFIKTITAAQHQCMQIGYISDKISSWDGGICVSGTYASANGYSYNLWTSYSLFPSQVYINGAWSTLSSVNAGGVYGLSEGELYTKMPFAYSGGILPVPYLLVRINPGTTSYRDPIGYAPDVRLFNGGDVYVSLEEMVIDGETWLPILQGEKGGTFNGVPETLIRLAV